MTNTENKETNETSEPNEPRSPREADLQICDENNSSVEGNSTPVEEVSTSLEANSTPVEANSTSVEEVSTSVQDDSLIYPGLLWEFLEGMNKDPLKIEETIYKMGQDKGEEEPFNVVFSHLPIKSERLYFGRVRTKFSHMKKEKYYNLKDTLKALRFDKKNIEYAPEDLYIGYADVIGLKKHNFKGFMRLKDVDKPTEVVDKPTEVVDKPTEILEPESTKNL